MSPGLATWNSDNDVWELYDLRNDFSQAHDLASEQPARLAAMKALFLKKPRRTRCSRSAPGFGLRLHPEDRIKTPFTTWHFDATTTRMPEFTAPGLGRESNHVTLDVECGDGASGVLYSLGGAAGGVTLYLDARPSRLRVQYDDHRALRCPRESELAAGRHRIEAIRHREARARRPTCGSSSTARKSRER